VLQRQLAEHLPSVMGDRLMVRRVLENVVGNALDSTAGRPGGAVIVSTEASAEDRVQITVADTGPGMTEAELQRAFDDFYSTKPGGSGLGLSIVRRLIMDLNGALRVETAPGAGTRVVIELPTTSGGTQA